MQQRSSKRTPRKLYTEDAFAAIPELRDTLDSGTSTPQRDGDDDDDADDFVLGTNAQLPSEDELEGDGMNSNDDEPGIEPDDQEDDDASEINVSRKKSCNRNRLPPSNADGQELYNRGIIDGVKYYVQANKTLKRQLYFGASHEDQRVVYEGFDKWAHLPVLPSVETGFRRPFVSNEEAFIKKNDEDWSWCSNTTTTGRQVITRSSFDEVRNALPLQFRCFLLGAVQTPKQYLLPPQAALPIGHAFDVTDRNGYIINAGAKINQLDWLPYIDGPLQYLAVATTTYKPTYTAAEAPAYHPAPPTQSLLQIWSIDTTQQRQPALSALLCTTFGDYRHMAFCRATAHTTGTTPRLLAGIFGDGSLRVILYPDIVDDDTVSVYQISQAVIASTPPDTIYSCFSWMSPRRIVAGCANGCVAVLDLADSSSSDTLRPRKYSSISPSYIIDIAACVPSSPTHFFTTSMDGHIRLTDSTQPNLALPGATVHTSRVRCILTSCVWHDYTRAGILTDDTFAVRMHLIRRIFNLFTVGRTISTPTATAVSPCHPFVLVGTTAGDVQCTNPMPKLIDSKAVIWQQPWFAHEWRRGAVGDDQHISQHGMSKFTEGLLPERVNLGRTQTPSDGMPGSVLTNTVYENESAITALSWNPNLHAAGWAAAGMADGLLRVEDISIP